MTDTAPARLGVTCCIAGGGPAGMMLGYLLARARIAVAVLEKHGDFFRDFRGDTIHPSTLELMHELGVLEAFLRCPHRQLTELSATIGDVAVRVADFRHLPTHCKFLAIMPQWDFLDFIAGEARRYPGFRLMMKAEVVDLVTADGRVAGVMARTPEGMIEIGADLVVAADGRHSTVREKAGMAAVESGAPMDVLWLRLTRRDSDGGQTLGHADRGVIFITIDRGDYWQCGFVIPKGTIDERRARGIAALRAEIAALAPLLADRVGEIKDWDDVKLLSVAVDRLTQWHRPGLLLIGDAAHAMSPIGGVGINFAVQDAVAAANILADPLRRRAVGEADLAAVQRRREWPVRLMQRLQILIQNRIITRVLASDTRLAPPLAMRLLDRYPILRRIPARVVGLGFRREHVRT
jgi:2-polyprenyl-6-methoxyphenol hydroxylase-like FAD-dependent oxidoreductase